MRRMIVLRTLAVDGADELELEDLQRPPEPEPRTGPQ